MTGIVTTLSMSIKEEKNAANLRHFYVYLRLAVKQS